MMPPCEVCAYYMYGLSTLPGPELNQNVLLGREHERVGLGSFTRCAPVGPTNTSGGPSRTGDRAQTKLGTVGVTD